MQLLQYLLMIHAVDGGPTVTSIATHCTAPLPLQISTLHHEFISPLVTVTKHLIILGFPCVTIWASSSTS